MLGPAGLESRRCARLRPNPSRRARNGGTTLWGKAPLEQKKWAVESPRPPIYLLSIDVTSYYVELSQVPDRGLMSALAPFKIVLFVLKPS